MVDLEDKMDDSRYDLSGWCDKEIDVRVDPVRYTGEVTVTSSDPDVVTAEYSN